MERYQNSSYRQPGRYQKKQSGGWPQILLFYVLPFLLFNGILFYCVIAKPKIEIAVADTNDYLSTQVTLTVKSWFPTKSISVTIDGEEVELEKGKKRTYTTTVYKNGSVEASVVNLNGMPANAWEHINVLDDMPPAFDSTEILDGVVTLTISDSQSGVSFESIYALNSAEQKVEPLTVDRSTNTLSFEMDPAGLHVFAQDKAGNEVQGTFTSHKEGDVETLEGGATETPEYTAAGTPDGTEPAPESTEAASDPQVTIN